MVINHTGWTVVFSSQNLKWMLRYISKIDRTDLLCNTRRKTNSEFKPNIDKDVLRLAIPKTHHTNNGLNTKPN